MEFLTGLITPQIIVAILAPIVSYIYVRYIKDDYKQEFGTFAQLVELIADRHNIGVIDTLNEILEEAGKRRANTKDIEDAVHKELGEIEKK